MSVDEIVEKTSIKLPKPYNLEDTENLLKYLSENIPASINYHISHYKTLLPKEIDELLK